MMINTGKITDDERYAIMALLEYAKEMRRCSERLMNACQSKLNLADRYGRYGLETFQCDNRVRQNVEDWNETNECFSKFVGTYLEIYLQRRVTD